MSINRARAACAALLCLLASACFLLPGKFGSELSLRRDGTFAFSYTGDIHVLALTKMAQEELDEPAKFEPQPCYDDDSGHERDCSDDEVAAQRADWDTQQEAAKAKKKQDAEMMQKMLGGIDPSERMRTTLPRFDCRFCAGSKRMRSPEVMNRFPSGANARR